MFSIRFLSFLLHLLLLFSACRGDDDNEEDWDPADGPRVDETFLEFTDSGGLTNKYHLFAGGLEWDFKPVGLLIYADGSGEFGLHNHKLPYLLSGPNGLKAVAQKHNMVLVTPFAPGSGCSDTGGVCWYLKTGPLEPDRKVRWSAELIDFIQSQYGAYIDKRRVVFGGYSSGAQWTTQYFGPTYANHFMEAGLAVAISYGGVPPRDVTPDYPDEFKANVPFVWDVGSRDKAYQKVGNFGVEAGYQWYTDQGFNTSLTVVEGLGHERPGEFGGIMDRAIEEHCESCFVCTDDNPFGTEDDGCSAEEGTPNCEATTPGGKGLSCYQCKNDNWQGSVDSGCNETVPNCYAFSGQTSSLCYDTCVNDVWDIDGVTEDSGCNSTYPNCYAGYYESGAYCFYCINDAEDGGIDTGCSWETPNCNGTLSDGTVVMLGEGNWGGTCTGPALEGSIEPTPLAPQPTPTSADAPPPSFVANLPTLEQIESMAIPGHHLSNLVLNANLCLSIVLCTLFI